MRVERVRLALEVLSFGFWFLEVGFGQRYSVGFCFSFGYYSAGQVRTYIVQSNPRLASAASCEVYITSFEKQSTQVHGFISIGSTDRACIAVAHLTRTQC
jgi:hypothetical protein